MMNRKIGIGLIIICFLIFIYEFTINGSFIGSDDAYIHLRYIKNFQDGQGFGFNPDSPSNGSTSPLWVIFASVFTRYSSNLQLSVKFLSVLLFSISIFIFYAIIYRLLTSHILALLATSIYASDPWLLKWAGSAMESSLVSILLLSAIFLLLNNKSNWYLFTAISLCGLATIARPENFLLFCLILVILLLTKKQHTDWGKRVLISIVIYFAILSPWLVYSIVNFGSPFPNTFTAKTIASGATIFGVGWYFIRVIGVTYWMWFIVLFSILVRIVTGIWKNRTFPSIEYKNALISTAWIWCIIIPAFYTFSRLQTPSTRYLQITTPLLIIVGFYGLVQLIQKTIPKGRLSCPLIGISVMIILYNIGFNSLIVIPSNNDFSEGILKTYQKAGEWIEENTPTNSRVAIAIDVGAVGYYSNRKIIDLGGLNTPEVIPYLPDNLGYVFIEKPDYLVITGERSEFALITQNRFVGVANPVISFPGDIGLRAEVDKATGGNEKNDFYVSVYHLSWP